VTGRGYSFAAPAGWTAAVRGRSSSATPEPGALELVTVRTFPLARPYEPRLWESVVPELDRVADQLATRLGGAVASRDTVTVAGRRARRFDIRYRRAGSEVVERNAFVLDGRREFQLTCRYPEGDAPPACPLLFSTFRVL
jgi:hypothetical protein